MTQKQTVCPDCWGSGWATQFVTPCPSCKGTGKIESILSPLPHQYGASADDFYHRCVNYEWNDVSKQLKDSIIEAIHQFAKSEVAKVVAGNKELEKGLNEARNRIAELWDIIRVLETKLSAANERIKALTEQINSVKSNPVTK